MIALCKKIILCYASLHDFHILYKNVPQLNVNSIIQCNEEKGFQGIKTFKTLSLKTQEATFVFAFLLYHFCLLAEPR